MCLDIQSTIAPAIYRWKFLVCNSSKVLKSPSWRANGYEWKFKTWMQSGAPEAGCNITQIGFHTIHTKKEALRGANIWFDNSLSLRTKNHETIVLVRVEVQGFKASGLIKGCDGLNGVKGEIWKHAKIIQVFDLEGKNITSEFKTK